VDSALFIAVSIAVAAIIGYITNYLAIKMLFLPRREWKVWGWRVPFTPGLIPKRKGEIAASLGRVVSDYLVTADGLKEVLQQPELRGQVERKLRELVENWAERDEPLEAIAARLLGPEQAAKMKLSLEQLAEQLLMNGVRSLWRESEARDGVEKTLLNLHRPLQEWMDRLHIPADELITRDAVPWLVQAVRAELASTNGLLLIHRIVTQMLAGLGGMMGMLAGMFVDEDKIALKVRDSLLDYLASPAAHDMLGGLLVKQKDQLVERTPAELLGLLRKRLELSGGILSVREDEDGKVGEDRKVGEDGIIREGMEASNGTYDHDPVKAGGSLNVQEDLGRSGGQDVGGEATGAETNIGSHVVNSGGHDVSGETAGAGPGSGSREMNSGGHDVSGETSGIGEMNSGGLTQEIGPLSDADWYASFFSREVPWRNWLDRLWTITPKQLIGSRREQLLGLTPKLTDRLMSTVSERIDQAVRTLNLAKLVQKQVEDFPMDQVEEVILGITGREFKAITWLGALLGGLIGIVQALFYLWLGS
jgi:uncharacterized membrane protein YheB (UPF0754 family)